MQNHMQHPKAILKRANPDTVVIDFSWANAELVTCICVVYTSVNTFTGSNSRSITVLMPLSLVSVQTLSPAPELKID